MSGGEPLDSLLLLTGLSPYPEAASGLPPPKTLHKKLLTTAMEVLDIWNRDFSTGYPILAAAVEYLSRSGVDLSSRSIVSRQEQEKKRLEEEKRKQMLKKQMESVVQSFNEVSHEINGILGQVNEAVELLVPKNGNEEVIESAGDQVEQDVTSVSTSQVDDEGGGRQEIQHEVSGQKSQQENGLISSTFELTLFLDTKFPVEVNEDSKDIVQVIRDQYKLLVRDSLPKLKSIMQNLSKGVEFTEETLKQAIDLKSTVLAVISKLADLNVLSASNHNVSEEESDDNEDFIEVEDKPGLQIGIPQHERHLYGLDPLPSTSRDADSREEGRCCRAPLPSGRLCPRQDANKCPFHGVIVDRDEIGTPVNEEDRIREEKKKDSAVPDWQDPSLLRDIEAATGVNLSMPKKGKGVKRKNNLTKNVPKKPRERLMDKVFSKGSRERVAGDLDRLDEAKHNQFGDNWAYSMNS